jgi:hypothetical protein
LTCRSNVCGHSSASRQGDAVGTAAHLEPAKTGDVKAGANAFSIEPCSARGSRPSVSACRNETASPARQQHALEYARLTAAAAIRAVPAIGRSLALEPKAADVVGCMSSRQILPRSSRSTRKEAIPAFDRLDRSCRCPPVGPSDTGFSTTAMAHCRCRPQSTRILGEVVGQTVPRHRRSLCRVPGRGRDCSTQGHGRRPLGPRAHAVPGSTCWVLPRATSSFGMGSPTNSVTVHLRVTRKSAVPRPT